LGAPPSTAPAEERGFTFFPDGAGGCVFTLTFDDDDFPSTNPRFRRVYWVDKRRKLEVFDFPLATQSVGIVKITPNALYLGVGSDGGSIVRRIKRTDRGLLTNETELGASEFAVASSSNDAADATGFFSLEYNAAGVPLKLRRYSN
jgi:hypothetical protein